MRVCVTNISTHTHTRARTYIYIYIYDLYRLACKKRCRYDVIAQQVRPSHTRAPASSRTTHLLQENLYAFHAIRCI